MRIALLTAQVPFVRGGAELLAESLQAQLRLEGHEVETVAVPLNWHPSSKLVDSLLAGSLIDLDELGGLHIDLAIGLKFPGYLAKHSNKRFWIIHQHRQAYDHWEDSSSDLLHQPDGALVKGAIEAADKQAFHGRSIFTISKNVSDRLERFLGIDSVPIYHPPPLAAFLKPGRSKDYLLVPSRLCAAKRQHLIIEALALCREPVRLVFVGKADEPLYEEKLRKKAHALGLENKVEWLSGLGAQELAALYQGAKAVVFTPVDEDYGYVTLEAMLSGKPVITTTDAGGPLEFIRDGKEGFVTRPTGPAIAEKMDRLWSDPETASVLGQAGRQRYSDLNIGWPQVLDHLLDRPARPLLSSSDDGTAPRVASACSDEEETRSSPPGTPDSMLLERLAGQLSVDEAKILAQLPVSSLDAVMSAFDIGRHANEEVRSYLQGHWIRYLETASLLPKEQGLRVLDLGAGKPHVFLALIKLIDAHAHFSAIVEAEHEAGGSERFQSLRGTPDLVVDTRAANLETGTLPFADETFDLVLAMEVLEHLVLNPAHMFAEAARVLRPGGSIIVTTPNIVSYRAISMMKSGNAPYSFGVFVPYHGAYGRHNREYTPHEVELLGHMAGFETQTLRTKDVYRGEIDAFKLSLLALNEEEYPLELRGQNIFYQALKTGTPRVSRSNSLYLEDPFAFKGNLRAEHRSNGRLILIFQNEGTEIWNGDKLGLQLSMFAGDQSRQTLAIDLPLAVPPGTTRHIELPIGPRKGEATSLLSIELEKKGRGWLNFVGVPRIQCVVRAGALTQLSPNRNAI